MNGAAEPEGGGYKRRYRALKRRLKLLLYEQECFQEELRRAQRKLLKVSRDKSFLLDRLLQYENVRRRFVRFRSHRLIRQQRGGGGQGTDPPPAKRRRTPRPPLPPRLPRPRPVPGDSPPPPHSPFPAEYLAPEGPARPRPAPPGAPRAPAGCRGEGSGDDALDGDDELVIDIPE
ncbi:unnamed protein product [Bubo scandiacus]